jgi:hypothetical protein
MLRANDQHFVSARGDLLGHVVEDDRPMDPVVERPPAPPPAWQTGVVRSYFADTRSGFVQVANKGRHHQVRFMGTPLALAAGDRVRFTLKIGVNSRIVDQMELLDEQE